MIIAEEDLSVLTESRLELLSRFITVNPIKSQPVNGLSNRFWTIDPIDGTKGFIREGGQYAICVALVEASQVQLAVIGCPRLPSIKGTGALFIAVKDHGVIEIDLCTETSRSLPISSKHPGLESAILAEAYESAHTDHSFSARFAQQLHLDVANGIKMDSQCKYGLVARSQAHIYLRRPTRKDYQEKIWVFNHQDADSFMFLGPRAWIIVGARGWRQGDRFRRKSAHIPSPVHSNKSSRHSSYKHNNRPRRSPKCH